MFYEGMMKQPFIFTANAAATTKLNLNSKMFEVGELNTGMEEKKLAFTQN